MNTLKKAARALDAAGWNEGDHPGDHPRAKNGQFTSGSGGGGAVAQAAAALKSSSSFTPKQKETFNEAIADLLNDEENTPDVIERLANPKAKPQDVYEWMADNDFDFDFLADNYRNFRDFAREFNRSFRSAGVNMPSGYAGLFRQDSDGEFKTAWGRFSDFVDPTGMPAPKVEAKKQLNKDINRLLNGDPSDDGHDYFKSLGKVQNPYQLKQWLESYDCDPSNLEGDFDFYQNFANQFCAAVEKAGTRLPKAYRYALQPKKIEGSNMRKAWQRFKNGHY